jgi:diguanylate cyclase (GGDEF)-like protein/PAS domain S-box-containing protein
VNFAEYCKWQMIFNAISNKSEASSMINSSSDVTNEFSEIGSGRPTTFSTLLPAAPVLVIFIGVVASIFLLAKHIPSGLALSLVSGGLIISATVIAISVAQFQQIRKLESSKLSLAVKVDESQVKVDMLVSESTELNQMMEQVSLHFTELFRRIPAPCFCFTSEGRFQEWNRAFEELTSLPANNILDSPLWKLITIEGNPANVQSVVAAVFSGESFEGMELETPCVDGSARTLLCNMFPLRGEGGKVTAAICAGINITDRISLERRLIANVNKLNMAQSALERKHSELIEANVKLEALAMSDSLTGLKNHRALQDRLKTEFKRSARYGSPVSIALVDVDKFKKYNDSFGHLAGDEVLRQVGRILASCTRDTDFVGRYGGEEFVVVMTHTDYIGALEAGERLRLAIEQAPWEQMRVTVSIGASTMRSEMSHFSELFAEADLALYYSKQHGRNQVFHANDLPDVSEFRTSEVRSTIVIS